MDTSSFARVDTKILSIVFFFVTNVCANLIGVPVSFVIETLSCELALANSSSVFIKDFWKFSFTPLVSTCLGAFVLANQVIIAGLDTRCSPD